MRKGLAPWIAGWVIVSPMDPASADLSHGAQIAATCAACHRFDSRRSGSPPIVGWDANRLVGTMHTFKSRRTTNPIMHAVSLSLSDDEIAIVAHYLAGLGTDAKP